MRSAVELQGYEDSIHSTRKGQTIAGLPQGCYKNGLVRFQTYCAINPLDVVGTVVTWPREVSDPFSLTRNPISAPAPETL